MIYLLKASAIICIFYFIYKLLLQKETFFQLNRVFLLVGFITALTIPFLIIPLYVEQTIQTVQNNNLGNLLLAFVVPKSIDWMQIVKIVYIIGFAFFSVKLIFALLSLRKVINSGLKKEIDGIFHIRTTLETLPFSYFNYIVYNPDQFNANELKEVLNHENIHVTQYHSIDVIVAQLFSVVFWFNPISWLYKKDIQQNLEFIADSGSRRGTGNKNSYQQLLLKLSIPDLPSTLTNNFYTSLIKKRIIMLHKNKSRKISRLKLGLVLPLLALFIFTFNTVTIAQTTTVKVAKESQKDIVKGIVTDINGKPIEGSSIVIKGTLTGVSTNSNGAYALKAPKGSLLVFSNYGMKTQEFTVDFSNEINMVLHVDKTASKVHLRGIGEPLYVVDGLIQPITVVQELVKNGDIYSITVLKGVDATKTYGENGKNGVNIISTKVKKDKAKR